MSVNNFEKATMTADYEIAIDVYHKTFSLIAERAGAEYVPTITTDHGALIKRAEELALPHDTSEVPGSLTPLRSIMGRLHQQTLDGYYRPNRIANSEAVVLPMGELPSDLAADYQKLWAGLEPTLSNLPSDPIIQEGNLHALLQQYAWAVPAPGSDVVSLFDFARVQAALAVCISHSDSDAPDAAPALLVGGDVSGVQDWIYTFGSSGAAKSLRGRSFFLQLLSETIAYFVLDRLELPAANLLYAGGGGFYLLAPNTKRTKEQLCNLRREISRKLITTYQGALYVALDSSELTEAMLKGEGGAQVGDAWRAVSKKLGQRKGRRFAELEAEEMAEVIGDAIKESGGPPEDICGVCGRKMTSAEKIYLKNNPREEVLTDSGQRACGQCRNFEELGNQLRTADYLVINNIDKNFEDWEWQSGLQAFGYDGLLCLCKSDLEEYLTKHNHERVRVYYWNDDAELPKFAAKHNLIFAYRPLAQCVPTVLDGKTGTKGPATFDQLESDGLQRWGVLRMDVDKLGDIFSKGMPGSGLSGVVGLSNLMRLFFEGLVPELASEFNTNDDKEKIPRIYLMYAGGDDLFVVGGWSDLPRLAHTIQQKFTKFACNNCYVTISGGITIAPGEKYPLYKAAEDAGEAEHAAKEGGRNALNFLGQTVSWKKEYCVVNDRVQQIQEWVYSAENPNGKLPRGFINTLRQIDAEWQTWKQKEDQPEGGRYFHAEEGKDKDLFLGPWLWHMLYSLKRAADRSKDEHIQKATDKYSESIVDGEIRWLGLTARWAELLTRQEEKGKE